MTKSTVDRKPGARSNPTPQRKAKAKPGTESRTQRPMAPSLGPVAGITSKPNRPPTAFEQRLYAVCKCIPAGKVSTYGALAEVLGSAARACGQALKRNPFAPTVPCHRIIASSLEIGGFSGSWGAGCANVVRKRGMLAEEGVEFDEAGHLLPASRSCLMSAAELRSAAAAARAL